MSQTARTAATLMILAIAGLAAARFSRAMAAQRAPHPELPVVMRPRETAAGARADTAFRPGAAYSAVSLREVGTPDSGTVRPAGPEAMRDAPRRGWDTTDEASDESFPASDPPATY